jgi:hypothetical protein
MHIIVNAYHCHAMVLVCYGIVLVLVLLLVCNGMVLVLVWYGMVFGIGILGNCKRKCSTMAMLCETSSNIHVKIRGEEYSLVWSKNHILR